MTDSTPKTKPRKRGRPSTKAKPFVPPKPYADFPLTPQSGGYWMKRIRGRLRYFGRWGRIVKGEMVRLEGDGWEEALRLYDAQKAALYAGREPEPPEPEREKEKKDVVRLNELCDYFMQSKLKARRAGKISDGMWHEYDRTCNLLMATWGKEAVIVEDGKLLLKPRDFSELMEDLEKRFGPVRQANEITRVKTLFTWAVKNEEIPALPNYGTDFVKPTRTVLRLHRATNGKKLWSADELRKAIAAAKVPMKAWLLLGVNSGFYAKDCADLEMDAVDLEGGWVDFARRKTGVPRRFKLWPETQTALRDYLAVRPKPAGDTSAKRFFLTDKGRMYDSQKIGRAASEHVRTCNLPDRLKLSWLRHTFRTVADGCLDQVAIHLCMGHADASIDDTYRQSIGDERLEKVAETVRVWLFGKKEASHETA